MENDENSRRVAEATDVFQKDVGVWDAVLEIHPGPGAPSIVQKGVSTNKRIGGGKWLVLDFQAESGFEGHGVYGWDPGIGKYIGTWVDSMMSSFAKGVGTWDAASRTMTFETETQHMGKTVRYRETTTTEGDGSVLVYRHLLPTPDGGEFEMIKATYRRRNA